MASKKRRRPVARIVRRKDALGRTFYQEKESGRFARRRAWEIDRERVRFPLPKHPPTPPPVPPFPPGVEVPGVPSKRRPPPELEDLDLDGIDWSGFKVTGIWNTPQKR